MVNVAIYVRLSDEDRNKLSKSDESESIQNQKSMLREYCRERDWNIYDIYNDEDYSGIDSTRPDFNRMINDCRDGKIDIVLCKSQSRFSRDAVLIETYLHDKFIEWGIRFIGVVDHADTDDKTNKKSRQILALTNEWYVEETSENIRRTLKHKREQGQFTGSFAPYGYAVDPDNKHRLIVDDGAAPVVRKIFQWYAEGWGYRKIVIELNSRGIPNPTKYKELHNSKFYNANERNSPNKGLWTHSTIYTMIRNETYTGTLVQSKSHNVSYKNKKRRPAPEDEWIKVYNAHEAIVDEATWNRVQQRLASRQRVGKTDYELSPLSGKVKCACCGSPMKRNVYYNKARTVRYYNLQCGAYKTGAMNCPNTKSVSGITLENAIISQLNDFIIRYNSGDIRIENDINNSMAEYERELAEITGQITDKETKTEQLYEDKLDGLITKEQFTVYNRKISGEIEALRQRREQTRLALQGCKARLNTQDTKALIEKYTHITELTRDIVDEFIDVIYVDRSTDGEDRKITIKWKF